MKITLGKKIKEARKQYRLSQEQLAKKMSISQSAVAKWEANNGLPDVDNLKALARLLNVSVDYLLDDSNIMAFIRKLRKKIEPDPDAPKYILTIWGIGYKMNDQL